MDKSKEYLKNTIIIFIGKFSTQFMTFLLLPLYTHYLLASDYGFVDLIQTYISLLIPVLTLRFDSAGFRFLIDERNNEKQQNEIINNIFYSLIVQIVIFTIIFVGVNCFFNINYSAYIYITIVSMMISNIFLQVLRGLGDNKGYSIASIITGFVTLITNIVLLCVFKFNASSILISASAANIICSLYLFYKIKLFKIINKKSVSKELLKKIAKYSIPMIPNSLSWWIVNVSDRTIISTIINTASNGIYSVSCKFSNILNSIFTIFNMSWQETASLHINDKDADSFFSDVINSTANLFICISLLILPLISIFFKVLIGDQFMESYNYIPILLLANIFNIYIGLFGGIYIAKHETKEVAKTTLLSAIINILINLLLIKLIGLYAAALSTLLSYIILTVYRYFGIQKYIKFRFQLKKILFLCVLLSIYITFYYLKLNVINLALFILSIIVLFIINKNFIIDFKDIFIKRKIK